MATIFDNIRPVQYPDPIEQQGRLMQLMAAQDKADLMSLERQKAQRGLEREGRLAALAQQYGDDESGFMQQLRRSGFFDESNKIAESIRKREADAATAKEKTAQATLHESTAKWREAQTKVEQLNAQQKASAFLAQKFGAIVANPTPDAAEALLSQLDAQGADTSGMRAELTRTGNVAQWADSQLRQGIAADKQMEDARKKWEAELLDLRAKSDLAERGRHNRATEDVSRGQLGVAQGQLGVAQSRLALDREKSKVEMDQPVYMQTEDGIVALPKKLAPGQAPTGTVATNAAGEPLTRPLKAIPPNVNNAIIENNTALSKLDQAMEAVKGNPKAFGAQNYIIPDAIQQRLDPTGVAARAIVADIGSLKIHDRSGAAVSAMEFPRLKPFIPQASDSPEVVITKLQNFKREAAQIQADLTATYSREQGYKPSPVLSDRPPAQPAATAAPTVQDTRTLNGKNYVKINGQWMEQ